MRPINTIFILLLLLSCSPDEKETASEQKSAYELVNPFIGTGGHGHTYPGATMPFGMVQLSPDTRLEGWDGCSGYHSSDSIIHGFSHTHLSGTGVSDYGDILLMPTQGNKELAPEGKDTLMANYASLFNKSSEVAKPGYYSVNLMQHNIDVRLTCTERVGIHEYTFNNNSDEAQIFLDLEHRDELVDWNITSVNDKEITGYRISKAWAEEQHVYFVMQTSEAFSTKEFSDSISPGRIGLNFPSVSNDKIILKVAISAVDVEGARKNLTEEADHWNFDEYENSAKQKWEKELQKIEIKGGTIEQQEIFYSALYHTMIAPNIFSDVDGRYRGTDKNIHKGNNTTYTVFSLWDTFRATHPLYTIIDQKRTNEYVNTFLQHYQDGGRLPVWELACNYTGCMIGYHSTSVITDSYVKGIRDYDAHLALEAMRHSSNLQKLGLPEYIKQGYIATGDEPESVSKTLEYAYDDWCIAILAKELQMDSLFEEYIERAQFYKNIFNPENKYTQPKRNGGWAMGFNPSEVNFNYTEANSWQYSMFVPQDIQGLINLYGGNDSFEQKLDELFTTKAEFAGNHINDITGLIGQYAHGNEPSHHMAYLYNYIGKPWKTQERTHQILTELYTNKTDGLSGNEDCGQMSAWYVLSSMGIYSVTPGTNYYAIGTPLFEEAKINLENGNQFLIKAVNKSDKNIYIQSATLNGQDFDQAYILHNDIMQGGELIFTMGDKPNKSWGSTNIPVSTIDKKHVIVPVPYFVEPNPTFLDSAFIEIKSIDNDSIFVQINDGEFKPYVKPFSISNSSKIVAITKRGELSSKQVISYYSQIDSTRSIQLLSPYENQYNGGGDNALINQLRGGDHFKTDNWQGYIGQDVVAIIDLEKPQPINKISIGALQDVRSWIWFPENIELLASNDNESFNKIGSITNDFPQSEYGSFVKEFTKEFNQPLKTRYIKVVVKNIGPCPEWHPGNGNPTFIFLDEITIE